MKETEYSGARPNFHTTKEAMIGAAIGEFLDEETDFELTRMEQEHEGWKRDLFKLDIK